MYLKKRFLKIERENYSLYKRIQFYSYINIKNKLFFITKILHMALKESPKFRANFNNILKWSKKNIIN